MISFRKKKQKLDSLSNEALFQLYARTKSKESYGEIYKRYAHLVYGACLKYLKDKNESRDITMDIFEDLMVKIPLQKDIQSFDKWIYFVIRNKCFSHMRDSKKMKIEPFDENFIEKRSDFHMENEGFLRLNSSEKQQPDDEMVLNAINQLNSEQKACIKAFFFEKKSYKQIVEQLGYPLAKVKSHIQNGKRNLKPLLKDVQIQN